MSIRKKNLQPQALFNYSLNYFSPSIKIFRIYEDNTKFKLYDLFLLLSEYLHTNNQYKKLYIQTI